ncbi:hypothetical protein [Xanthomonas axonopodis]|uniref:hypothetical protein n=1 Tax=Xanthomonas axonopodis TaxID=53413 RepID=UPI0020165E98|nr:hypothetical protein [Xanthomonas axonopodis]
MIPLIQDFIKIFKPQWSKEREQARLLALRVSQLDSEVRALRAAIFGEGGQFGLVDSRIEDVEGDVGALREGLTEVKNELSNQATSSLRVGTTLFNVILSAFFALIFFGSPVVLNEAESRAVFDYFLYIGPAVSAIIAGFGLYASKGKRIFGIGVDGLFFCVSASFLFLCVVAYAFSKGYLATMLSQSLGVFLLLPLLWILSSLIGKKISIGIVSFLVVFIS